MSSFLHLSRPACIGLAAALETGRLTAPFYAAVLTGLVPAAMRHEVVAELEMLDRMGMRVDHIAYLLRTIARERSLSQTSRDCIDLVWTGDEGLGSQSRDTRIVVRELFATAQRSVLISSYALDKGKKAKALFQVLAARMDANPNFQVRMFLNVQRPYRSTTSESVLLREFADTFRQEIWPGTRLPEVFHDPRSLSTDAGARTCLHAKCVVVDEERLFVTSANFTEAAHERNIEAGVLIADAVAAKAMRSQFEALVYRKILRRVPGL
jgi:PLD-like domain